MDEALESVNGSTVFSKLDFRMGFHQVELAEESRDLTTFVTPDGLFRYKRLSFGVNSAPEKFQHIVREVLAGCDGVLNIHDDIIVHDQDEAEHNRCLIAVLERLQGARIDAQSSQVRISFTEGAVHGLGVITLWNWTGIRESQSDCGGRGAIDSI